MDFFKDQAHLLSRAKTSAYKEYQSGFNESLIAGDSELFSHLVLRREATFSLYNDYNKTVNQILKTTIDSFQ